MRGRPLSLKCPACRRKGYRRQSLQDFRRTGRERLQSTRRERSMLARELRCLCGHVWWSTHRDGTLVALTD